MYQSCPTLVSVSLSPLPWSLVYVGHRCWKQPRKPTAHGTVLAWREPGQNSSVCGWGGGPINYALPQAAVSSFCHERKKLSSRRDKILTISLVFQNKTKHSYKIVYYLSVTILLSHSLIFFIFLPFVSIFIFPWKNWWQILWIGWVDRHCQAPLTTEYFL